VLSLYCTSIFGLAGIRLTVNRLPNGKLQSEIFLHSTSSLQMHGLSVYTIIFGMIICVECDLYDDIALVRTYSNSFGFVSMVEKL
jgi:hypothetical protein